MAESHHVFHPEHGEADAIGLGVSEGVAMVTEPLDLRDLLAELSS